ncbi:MutS protein msh5 [Globomyces sp. JEL0801]|nr:MutS protein msh5 [Globomyces sp. JEL0801]
MYTNLKKLGYRILEGKVFNMWLNDPTGSDMTFFEPSIPEFQYAPVIVEINLYIPPSHKLTLDINGNSFIIFNQGNIRLHALKWESIQNIYMQGLEVEQIFVKSDRSSMTIKDIQADKIYIDNSAKSGSIAINDAQILECKLWAKIGNIVLEHLNGKCIKISSKSLDVNSEILRICSNSAALTINDSRLHLLDIVVLNTNLFLDFMNVVTDSLILNLNQFVSSMKIAIQSCSAQIKMKGKCVTECHYPSISNQSLEHFGESQDTGFNLSGVIQIKSDYAKINTNIEHYNAYIIVCNNASIEHDLTGKQGQLTDIKFTDGRAEVHLGDFVGMLDCKTIKGDIGIFRRMCNIYQETPQHALLQFVEAPVQSKFKCFTSKGVIIARIKDESYDLSSAKKIGFIGALALLFNAATGPAIPFTPNAFQNPGWIFSLASFLLFFIISTFSVLFVIEAMQAIPGNKDFQGDVEYATMINFYFGKPMHYISQFFLYFALHCQSIQGIILCSQSIDNMLVDILGKTCGVALGGENSGWYCVSTHGDKLSPFGDQFMFFTFVLCGPLLHTNLDDNIVSFALSVMMCMQWIYSSFANNIDFKRLNPTDTSFSSYGNVLGTIMLNMALTVIIPIRIVIKLNINLVGLGFDGSNPNALAVIAQIGTPRVPVTVTYYLFCFVFLLPSIPVNFIISRDNLVQNEVVGEKLGIFLGFILPWMLCIPIQTGNLLPIVQNWTSTVFVSPASYLLPVLLYIQCRKFRKEYNSHRTLNENQLKLLLKIHERSHHITKHIAEKLRNGKLEQQEVIDEMHPDWLEKDVPDPDMEDVQSDVEMAENETEVIENANSPKIELRVSFEKREKNDINSPVPIDDGLLAPDNIVSQRRKSTASVVSNATMISTASTLPAIKDWKVPAFRTVPKWVPFIQGIHVAWVVLIVTSVVTVDQTIRDAVNGQNDLTSPFTMELRSALDFKFSNSLQKIQNLGSTVLNIQSHIDSLLNVNENCVSIASAGAILAHLTDLDQLDIHQCEVIHLNFHMQLSAETYSHPNMHSNKERDHSSLFQLLNQTKSPVGNQLMKSWFMKPLQNLNDIQSRQSLISFFNHPHNNHLIKELQRHLSDTPNLPMLMSRIRMKNNPSDWKLFYKFLSSTIKICSIFMDVSSTDFELLQFFQLESIQTILNRLYQAVDFRIDFQSPESDRITIKSNVDVTLDEMKRFYQGLDSFLSELADNLQLPTIPASEFNLLYYPQLGFLISIGFPTDLKDAFEIDGLTFQFMDQNRGFYKNEVMFDAQFGDIHSNIVDLELELLQVLRDEIFEHYHQLISISKRLAELDCIVSLSFVAGNFGYCKPEMVHDNCILLEKSRHPIVERHLDTNFIANDVEIGEGNENRNLFKSLIITGPNSSGKSVYLQQVALIVFMAHLGSFVPCDKAIIGITDKILVRLSASSSVLSNQSSFYHDLNQARACIFDSTPKSLVIMDEFGKGTIPSGLH